MAQSSVENLSEQTFTESTVRKMYRLIDRAKTDAEFQKLVYGVVNGAMRGNWKNYRQELSTLLMWVRKAVDYRRDPYGVELLQDVWATLDRRRGDCDDFTILLCAAAEVLGAPCRIVTVSTRADREPSHVYGEAMVGGKWLGMDGTIPSAALGWQPPHVTDKKIWTRKELGLGGDDLEGVEGMSDYDVPGFKSNLYPVSRQLAPGVPDDISDTYANGIPGPGSPSRRVIWQAPIANVSDRTSMPRPGGGVYQPAYPIKSFPTPEELWSSTDRKFVPKVLDPESAWWGKIPTSREDFNRMFPGSEGTMDSYLREIASVPASAIAEISDDVNAQLQLGEIGYDEVPNAIGEAVEDYALGKLPRMKRGLPGKKAPRKWRGQNPVALAHQNHNRGPAPVAEKKYLIPGPGRLTKLTGGRLNGMGSMGDIITDLAKQLSTQVVNGTIPGDTTSINNAINQAVDLATGAAPKPASTLPSVATIAKAGIPMGMLGLLAAVAFMMSRKGGSRKYRSNPSRRRSRSRGRGRRGGNNNTMLMLAAGGAAAYYFLLRPGAALQPRVPTSTTPTAPKPSSTQQYAAAAIQAAPSIISAITNLFSSGSSGTPVPGAVTDLSTAQGTAIDNAVVSL